MKLALADVTAFLTGCHTDSQAVARIRNSPVFALSWLVLAGYCSGFGRVRKSDHSDTPAALPARTAK